MTLFIVLLRGINVGGHKKIPMAELRELIQTSGYKDVQTYIQSGNIILKASEENLKAIEQHISMIIEEHFGFRVSVLVKTREQLQSIFDSCPFEPQIKEASYFAMLQDQPEKALIEIASEKVYDDDHYHITEDCIYFYPKKGYGQSKLNLNYFERKLHTNATARNYKTMVKLLSLSE